VQSRSDFVETIRFLPNRNYSRERHVPTLQKFACACACGFAVGSFALDLAMREKLRLDIRE
jgi:hypothetical protein